LIVIVKNIASAFIESEFSTHPFGPLELDLFL